MTGGRRSGGVGAAAAGSGVLRGLGLTEGGGVSSVALLRTRLTPCSTAPSPMVGVRTRFGASGGMLPVASSSLWLRRKAASVAVAAEVGESCHAPFDPWMLSLMAVSCRIAASICSTLAVLLTADFAGVDTSCVVLLSFIASHAADERVGGVAFAFHQLGATWYRLALSDISAQAVGTLEPT